MTTFLAPTPVAPITPPVYRSGRRYPMGVTSTNGTQASGRLYLFPLRFERAVTLNSLGFQNFSAVVGTARVGLYNLPSELGGSGAKIIEGTGDISTNVGVASLSDTITSTPLPAGLYCGAIAFSAAAVVYNLGAQQAITGWVESIFGDASGFGVIAPGGYQVYQTAGVTYSAGSAFMPATLTALTITNGTPGSPVMDVGIA